MGLFDKRSAQEKEFDKAFTAALKKPNEKTFGALEAACLNYTPGWQGWLLMGLCYDCGAGVIRNTEKAFECHARAKLDGEAWTYAFYRFYERSAGNIYVDDLTDRTLACRRMGVAAMSLIDVTDKKQNLAKGYINNDIEFFRSIFSKVDIGGLIRISNEQLQASIHIEPFVNWIAATIAWGSGNTEEAQRLSNEFFKKIQDLKKKDADSISSIWADSWLFTGAMSLLYAGCYGGFIYDFRDQDKTDRYGIGLNLAWQAADLGNLSAMFFLADMAEDEQYRPLIIRSSTHRDALLTLAAMLGIAEEKQFKGAKEKLEDLMNVLAAL